jgi:hypothetical protein
VMMASFSPAQRREQVTFPKVRRGGFRCQKPVGHVPERKKGDVPSKMKEPGPRAS